MPQTESDGSQKTGNPSRYDKYGQLSVRINEADDILLTEIQGYMTIENHKIATRADALHESIYRYHGAIKTIYHLGDIKNLEE